MKMMKNYRLGLLALGILVIGGCAGQTAFDYHDASEIPEGPGMFTGGGAVLSLKGEALAAEYRGEAGPSDFLRWKEAFEQASEHQKYEMWLQLQSN